jgi:deoxyribodipyrimidine photo-lyase
MTVMDNDRSRQINDSKSVSSGPVVYWMSRDQRTRDNWSLLYAQKEAIKRKVPLVVLFCFVPNFLEGTLRQYGFMLHGLWQVERSLRKSNIPFFFISGEPKEVIPKFLRRIDASGLFIDFSPLRTKKRWLRDVAQSVDIPIFEVDAHNIVPCWKLFSEQAESTVAFRLKLRGAIPLFLNAFPALRKHPVSFQGGVPVIDWDTVLETLSLNRLVSEVSWVRSGESDAHKVFRQFLKEKVREYKSRKPHDDMRREWQWRLQPYLHFGQLSIQKIAWAVMHSEIEPRFKAAFLESLITRRELADHFCYHNTRYASFHGFPKWAQATLDEHRHDAREFTYSKQTLESAHTHDDVWNDIQQELVSNGRIFGWAIRYWAKKILEWTCSPEDALRFAISFMEKYSLNGWDPNGYLKIAKAIGGVYDTPSKTIHPVFGSVPYMQAAHKEARRDLQTYEGKD